MFLLPDYVAYRDVQDGSVYISILCELLHKEGLDSTLTDLLHKVNYYASTIVGVTDTESDITQVPIFTSTLRRPLQFTKRKQVYLANFLTMSFALNSYFV